MIHKVKAYIADHQMLSKGDRVVAGVSGGADSICLLHVLLLLREEYELTLAVIHINHGIRGPEAERDESFVKEFCKRNGIEYESSYYDVRKIARDEGISEEEAGRKVRYEAFFHYCEEHKFNRLAIAHNKNDNAETVLFHLFRGAGIRGMSGIEPCRTISLESGEVTLIRPLLDVTREEIEKFLGREDIPYLVDSTNLTDEYSRNKIRNQILTYASREINTQAVSNIADAAVTLREIEDYLDAQIQERFVAIVHRKEEGYRVSIDCLRREPRVIQKGIVILILQKLAGKSRDLEAKHVTASLTLLSKQVSRRINLPYGIIAEREYDNIRFFRDTSPVQGTAEEAFQAVTMKVPGVTDLPGGTKAFVTEIFPCKKYDPIPKNSCAKWFDYDKIENAVEIRTRREGDYIQINASGGRKKLKDYFIDQKIPQKVRNSQILITDGSHVMWIPGMGDRMSEKYKVEPSTTRILLIKMIDLEEMKDDR